MNVLRPNQDISLLRAENDPKPQKVEVKRAAQLALQQQARQQQMPVGLFGEGLMLGDLRHKGL